MKKLTALLLAVAMVLALAACGSTKAAETTAAPAATEAATQAATEAATEAGDDSGIPADGPVVTLKFAHDSGETALRHDLGAHLKEVLEEKSNGKMTIEIYDGTLGNVDELCEAIMTGSIDLLGCGFGASFGTEFSFIDSPIIFGMVEQDKVYEIYNEGSTYRDMIDELLDPKGITLACLIPVGFRQLTSNKEYTGFDSLKGLKIRTPTNTIFTKTWEAFGASVTPIPLSEVYMAFQQGLVDAHENPYSIVASNNFYEVQKYMVDTRHIMNNESLVYNDAMLESLDPAYQACLLEAIDECIEWSYEYGNAFNEEALQTCLDGGMTFVEVSDEDRAKMFAAVGDVYKYIRETSGDAIVEQLLSELGLDTTMGK